MKWKVYHLYFSLVFFLNCMVTFWMPVGFINVITFDFAHFVSSQVLTHCCELPSYPHPLPRLKTFKTLSLAFSLIHVTFIVLAIIDVKMRVLWIQAVVLLNEFCILLSLGTIAKPTERSTVDGEELRLSLNPSRFRIMSKKDSDMPMDFGIKTKFTTRVKAPIAIHHNFEPLIQDHRIVKRNASHVELGNQPSPYPTCEPEKSCVGRCTINTTEWKTQDKLTCSCDPGCDEVFNDCCADYEKYCGFQKPKNVSNKKYNWTCEKIGYYDSKYCTIADGMWLVSRCAEGWPNDNTRTKCETPLTKLTISTPDLTRFLPVIGQNNVTFRNLHCALCNSIVDYEQWPLNIEASVIPPESYNLTQKIQFLLSHGATFPDKDHLTPKLSHPRRYCLNHDARDPHSCFPDFKGLCRRFVPLSFSLVLDYRRSNGNSKMEKYELSIKNEECGKQGMIYDNILQACRVNWLAPPDQNEQDRFYVVAWLEPPKTSQDNEFSAKDFKKSFIEYFNTSYTHIINVNISSISKQDDPRFVPVISFFLVTSTVILTPRQSLELSSTNRNAYNTLKPSLLNFIYFKEPLTMNIKNSNYTVIKTTSRPLACLGRKLYTPKEYTLLDDDKVYINSTNITYGKSQYFREISEQSTLGNITVCEKYVPTGCNATWTTLAPKQFTLMANLSIYHNETAIIYHYGQYDILSNGSVAVCYSLYIKPKKTVRDDEVLGWITFACFLVSILFLTFLLVTYILFPQLRTLPGKNLMNLAASLLLFELFWILVGFRDFRSNVSLCTATAVIEHYLLLSYFASMSVVAFHTYKVFARQLPAPKSSDSHEQKLFSLYLVFIWLIPGIFVIVCFILDKKEIMSVGYGDSGTCWIGEKDAYIYYVTLPITLLLSFNIVTFTASVIHLRKHAQNRAAMQASGVRRPNLLIYMKLSTLMGFTWLFAFLAYIAEHSIIFWYLFVLLTSLQGFFITVAFVLNKKTLRMYRRSSGKMQKSDTPKTRSRDLTNKTSDETNL